MGLVMRPYRICPVGQKGMTYLQEWPSLQVQRMMLACVVFVLWEVAGSYPSAQSLAQDPMHGCEYILAPPST